MSAVKTNNVQFGQSNTATDNLTLTVPNPPNGTLKLARGNQGATTTDILIVGADNSVSLATGGLVVGATASQTLTNKTISYSDNTLIGIQPTLVSGTTIKTINGSSVLGSGDLVIAASSPATTTSLGTVYASANSSTYPVITSQLANRPLLNIKTASFDAQLNITSTSGTINIDWSAAQNYRQNEPTGTITYTFTNPPGPCHLQLIINSDGASSAQIVNWPSLTWFGSTWSGVNNKKAVINFWFDGANYFAQGINEV